MTVETTVNLPTGIPLLEDPTQELSFFNIYQTFAESPWGPPLARNVRYYNGGKGYKPRNVTHKEWKQVLGRDVCNQGHLRYTERLTRAVLWYNSNPPVCWQGPVPSEAQFSLDQNRGTILAAIAHDWGETPPFPRQGFLKFPPGTHRVGDKRFGTTSSDDKAIERQIALTIGNHYFGTLVGNHWLERAADIWNNDGSPEGKLFAVIERLGYLSTGVRAWKEGKKGTHKPALTRALDKLSIEVSSNHLPDLVEAAAVYPGIRHLLQKRGNLIDEIILMTPQRLATAYNQAPEKLTRARQSWREFNGLP